MSRTDFLEDFVGTSLWSVVPAKHRFRYRKQVNTGMVESHRLALTMGGVIDRSLDDTDGLQSSDYSTYQIFEPGDLAFKLIDLQNIRTSRVGLVPRRGIMSPAYIRLSPSADQVYPPFYYWYFYAAYLGNIFNGLGGGIRQNLSQTELLEFPVPDISVDDQQAIARFLDRETARIDGLIEKKTRFIALLKEKRTAVITHAVTKGLDPDVPMKDGGFKALGSVPEHWDISPTGRAFRLTRRTVGSRHTEFKLLSLTTRGVIERDISENFGKFPESFDTYQEVRPGNFVFCLFDIDETPRTVARSDLAGMVTGAYAVFDCIAPEYSSYLLYLFLHLDACKGLKPFYTGLRKTIRPPKFTSIRIPFPPAEEAMRIAAHIDRETAKIDSLIAKTERSIDLLREKRSALITAAVTGKIDVRAAA